MYSFFFSFSFPEVMSSSVVSRGGRGFFFFSFLFLAWFLVMYLFGCYGGGFFGGGLYVLN